MKKFAPLLFVLVVGCATFAANTPAQKVFALQSDYNALLAAAVAYESQPRCSDTVPVPCSDGKVVTIIRGADTAAHTALRTAQTVVRTPGVAESTTTLALVSATQAVFALRGVLTELGVN